MKNKIVLISKEFESTSLKNITLKNNFDSYVCHATITSSSCEKKFASHACTTSSSIIENDICLLKKSVNIGAPLWVNVPWTTQDWNSCF